MRAENVRIMNALSRGSAGTLLCCILSFIIPVAPFRLTVNSLQRIFVITSSSRVRQSLAIDNGHVTIGDGKDEKATKAFPVVSFDSKQNADQTTLVSVLIQVAYDGSRFTGWSSANDPCIPDESHTVDSEENAEEPMGVMSELTDFPVLIHSGRKRRRREARMFDGEKSEKGYIRSVQGVIQKNVAKLYGNIEPVSRIVVEGSSRTDKGVHARMLVAQVYGIHKFTKSDESEGDPCMAQSSSFSIPGKRRPHPRFSHDYIPSLFLPFPIHKMSLDMFTYRLNRMLPDDVRIVAIAPSPQSSNTLFPFHPTLSTIRKTYVYNFSVGPLPDPTKRRQVWHLGNVNFDENTVTDLCRAFEGTHDFAAFAAAPRGKTDRKKRSFQSTLCHIDSVCIKYIATPKSEEDELMYWSHCTNYAIRITGNRFLYKMVRFIVGAMISICFKDMVVGMSKNATGTLTVDHIRHALLLGTRNDSLGREGQWFCAPAHGLVLENVEYDEDISWEPACG